MQVLQLHGMFSVPVTVLFATAGLWTYLLIRQFLELYSLFEEGKISEEELEIRKAVIYSDDVYCTNCGHKLDSDSLFCPECGHQILFDDI